MLHRLAPFSGIRDREISPPRMTTSFGMDRKGRRISSIQPQFTSKNSISGRASKNSTPTDSPTQSPSRPRRRSRPHHRAYPAWSARIRGTKGQMVA